MGSVASTEEDVVKLRARSLAPLVKARGFGMTPLGWLMKAGENFFHKQARGSGQECPLHRGFFF